MEYQNNVGHFDHAGQGDKDEQHLLGIRCCDTGGFKRQWKHFESQYNYLNAKNIRKGGKTQ
jgi:hypothetical protein